MKKLILFFACTACAGLLHASDSYADSYLDAASVPMNIEPANDANHDSVVLIAAAQAEILAEQQAGSTETACDLFLEKVLNRAGFKVDHFLANDFDSVMHQDLPAWKSKDVAIDSAATQVDSQREVLREFLNSAPDQTVFLAQWPRVGRSGHVAMVVKQSSDVYLIYQAQLGLSLPAARPVKIEGLLYPQGAYGDRSHIRLFFE